MSTNPVDSWSRYTVIITYSGGNNICRGKLYPPSHDFPKTFGIPMGYGGI